MRPNVGMGRWGTPCCTDMFELHHDYDLGEMIPFVGGVIMIRFGGIVLRAAEPA